MYFASDFHLGIPDYATSLDREKKIVSWLSEIEKDATEIFLVGDVFDFWFEHKFTAPKNYVRLLGKLAQLTDSGIKIYLFLGNHDMWQFGYLEKECGIILIKNELEIERNGKKFFIHHGDGLGKGDNGYKLIKSIFRSPISQWLFARIHPNLSFQIANFWSQKSRQKNYHEKVDEKDDFIIQFIKEHSKRNSINYYICGHRHLAALQTLNNEVTYCNLGDWFNNCTYAVFENNNLSLKTYVS